MRWHSTAKTTRDLLLSRFDRTYDTLRPPRQARARTIEPRGREVASPARELLTKEPAHV
ncbi:hypothetical protein [Streptomyces sp. Act143]|uniref:hypothetical protein n=1 Tax=Streptomyces sp. Act143 TaxID=2200760 RepID=UPI0015E806E5|nr:hypothetical protein [Streptomyces sp. Act143]